MRLSTVAFLGIAATPLFANSVSFSGSGFQSGDGVAISFSALFETTTAGGNPALKITLTNTSTDDIRSNGEVLTALYFFVSGGPILTPFSAALGPGSNFEQGGSSVSSPSTVGQNWGYKEGSFSGPAAGGANEGIGASGVSGNFSQANFCSTGCNNLDGADYGLVPAAPFYPGNENGGLSGEIVIQNSAVFVLTGIAANFDPSTQISGVVAQYGTSTDEPQVRGTISTPEPVSSSLLALGFGALCWKRRNTPIG